MRRGREQRAGAGEQRPARRDQFGVGVDPRFGETPTAQLALSGFFFSTPPPIGTPIRFMMKYCWAIDRMLFQVQ